jgi:glycosyl transferase family 11
MVIIQMDGGLGNQMFGYALYCSFLQRGTNAKLDLSKYTEGYAHNGYELEKIFNVKAAYCSPAEKKIVKPISKLMHVFFKHPYKETNQTQWTYQAPVANIKFGFLKGYWQTEDYFINAKEIIRQKFRFPALSDDANIAAFDQIKSTNSISLHIRRGDYLLDGRSCTINIDYYKNAVALINKKVTDPHFFIFSDDIEWAKENIREQNSTFIDWNSCDKSYVDMQLMSTCKHNIIANSSFSWWGAWLNNNPGKIVIAPQHWMPHTHGTRDLIPGSWIKIPVDY